MIIKLVVGPDGRWRGFLKDDSKEGMFKRGLVFPDRVPVILTVLGAAYRPGKVGDFITAVPPTLPIAWEALGAFFCPWTTLIRPFLSLPREAVQAGTMEELLQPLESALVPGVASGLGRGVMQKAGGAHSTPWACSPGCIKGCSAS